jgi:hypothetical protein
MARPTEFQPEYVEQAAKLCEILGATDRELAEFFEVSETTINNWKLAHPAFLESLKRGKEHADARVEQSLYRRALGYSHDAVKIFHDKDTGIVEAPFVEHYPPETTACIFWLKNRKPGEWRDRTQTELTGKDGGPLVITSTDAQL